MAKIIGSVRPPVVEVVTPVDCSTQYAVVKVENIDVSADSDPRVGNSVRGVDRVTIEALGSGPTASAAVTTATENAAALLAKRAAQFEAATRQWLGASNLVVTFDCTEAATTAKVSGIASRTEGPFATSYGSTFESLERTHLGKATWYGRPYADGSEYNRQGAVLTGIDDEWD